MSKLILSLALFVSLSARASELRLPKFQVNDNVVVALPKSDNFWFEERAKILFFKCQATGKAAAWTGQIDGVSWYIVVLDRCETKKLIFRIPETYLIHY